ncbi:hypothetical protein [Flavihumibacter profundi]|jgi:hypothetical protein|uniref:hypothetical protein n=1 Tax=Flavihumibacter profundi TaxID=2716883 RepID=UPI001CC80E68|nr:hypothetical protein [Flavihumibacter profundi]MBZ5858919.1 hypothetical protein [Flavihumibacter profundi]
MQQILHGWNWMRFLRLAVGLYALVQVAIDWDPMLAAAGVFLSAMAVFNIGCCGIACAPNFKSSKRNEDATKDISFEEVK